MSSNKTNAISLFVFNARKGIKLIVMNKNLQNLVRHALRWLLNTVIRFMLRPDFFDIVGKIEITWGFLCVIFPALPELPPLS